jgi:hypothetical protein
MSVSAAHTDRYWIRRAFSAGVVLIVAVFGFLLVGAVSASAAEAPAGFTSDGCTLVPEAPSGVDFHDSCVAHDLCYFTHTGTRAACDAALYNNLKQDCAGALSVKQYTSCRAWATLYYAGVRLFGGYYWNASGLARTQTPLA